MLTQRKQIATYNMQVNKHEEPQNAKRLKRSHSFAYGNF